MKPAFYEICMAEARAAATSAIDLFLAAHSDKYPGSTECLTKECEGCMPFKNAGGAVAAHCSSNAASQRDDARLPTSYDCRPAELARLRGFEHFA